MSNYLYKKYFGKYRILVPIDETTNDFPRDVHGNIDTDDFYIPCRRGNSQIYHYGRQKCGVLIQGNQFMINNFIKACEDNNVPLYEITYSDEEARILFNAKHVDFVAEYLQARTLGKNIRPFSVKNLPKSDYQIPTEQMAKYKDILALYPEVEPIIIMHITNDFLNNRVQKSLGKTTNVGSDIRKNRMSRQLKEYIHLKGFWDEYLDYLNKQLKKRRSNGDKN